jgi:hypothetical protein
MKYERFIVIVGLVIFITACVSVAPPLKSDYKPSNEEAFIFGSFVIIQTSSTYSIGLTIQNENGKEYTIKFLPDSKMQYQVISVTPGTYTFKKILYMDSSNGLVGSDNFKAQVNYPIQFTIEKGEAIYVGDFLGFTSLYQIAGQVKTFSFTLNNPENKYTETVNKVMNLYPFMQELKIKNIFGIR